MQNRIFLHGNVDNIADKMLNSSALLLSSRWEGMPMVVLEALECGLPVIAYDISAVKPLIANEVEGFVVEKFDNTKVQPMMIPSDDILDKVIKVSEAKGGKNKKTSTVGTHKD